MILTLALALAAPLSQAPSTFSPLFDGADLRGWRGRPHLQPHAEKLWSPEKRSIQQREWNADMEKHWSVESGEIVNDGAGVFLTTEKDFRDFDLRLEYKTVAGADSGIYLRACPQVQIWDWTKEGGKWELGAGKGSGALWNNIEESRFPSKRMDRPFGEWNTLRIVMIGPRVSVWLNETQIVHQALMENYFDRSSSVPESGPIQLQTHGGEIRFRNLKIKEFSSEEALKWLTQAAPFEVMGEKTWSPNPGNYIASFLFETEEDLPDWIPRAEDFEEYLYPKGSLNIQSVRVNGNHAIVEWNGFPVFEGEHSFLGSVRASARHIRDLGKAHWRPSEYHPWKPVGEATFLLENGMLTGSGNFGRNAFFISEEEFSDFELNVDVKLNSGGNSGIQIRSKVDEKGKVSGYQIEIDGSPRAWSGGLYEEAGRGWLQNLEDNPEGNSAFHVDEWNHYRVLCRGERIQSWVNGIPCADFRDSKSGKGLIGFQVHSGGKTNVSWKNLFIRELGPGK
ncbi:MAG: DUF1080 domain-containing protein [Planctomycetota bacterium]|nr:DUF1080 domain-containing protein [Planctomycetota bacterium]